MVKISDFGEDRFWLKNPKTRIPGLLGVEDK